MDLSLGHTRVLVGECERQGLLRNQCAYVLATTCWETARTMKPVVEAFWSEARSSGRAGRRVATKLAGGAGTAGIG